MIYIFKNWNIDKFILENAVLKLKFKNVILLCMVSTI